MCVTNSEFELQLEINNAARCLGHLQNRGSDDYQLPPSCQGSGSSKCFFLTSLPWQFLPSSLMIAAGFCFAHTLTTSLNFTWHCLTYFVKSFLFSENIQLNLFSTISSLYIHLTKYHPNTHN